MLKWKILDFFTLKIELYYINVTYYLKKINTPQYLRVCFSGQSAAASCLEAAAAYICTTLPLDDSVLLQQFDPFVSNPDGFCSIVSGCVFRCFLTVLHDAIYPCHRQKIWSFLQIRIPPGKFSGRRKNSPQNCIPGCFPLFFGRNRL